MLYIATSLLFFLAFLSLYALIKNNRNLFLLFFLVPVILGSSIFAGYAIFILQGTPIDRLPKGQVEVVWAEAQKPIIVFLVRHEGKPIPKYYRMNYTKDNYRLLDSLAKSTEKGKPEKGEFKHFNSKTNPNVKFDTIKRNKLPSKNSEPRLKVVIP